MPFHITPTPGNQAKFRYFKQCRYFKTITYIGDITDVFETQGSIYDRAVLVKNSSQPKAVTLFKEIDEAQHYEIKTKEINANAYDNL